MHRFAHLFRAVHLLLSFFLFAGALHAAPPKFDSKNVTARTPGHAVDIEVDLAGARKLFLVVTDAGDGYGCDWADWAEPRLIGPQGEKRLTELKWKGATADWGQVRVDRNADGGPLVIEGKPVSYGIGTHANSVIEFDLPEGYTTFKARAGLDQGGTRQNGGNASSVRFLVFLEQPSPEFVRAPITEDADLREPENALAGLEVAEGLEAQIFAAEPMLLSPSDIDVDHLGRVWVCEVVNYRHRNDSRPEGDRILILEDTNADGRADKQTVFYQGRDIDSALGICVLGNKVIVSCAPNVFVLTDENGDGKADKKELLFTKVGQPQHDHSTHAFVFGPDGKLYWNVGNTGKAVHDKDGNPIVDLAGNTVNDSGNPYRQGLAFRCNLDGSQFEVLGHNFRNNYELAVDSFGSIWQSDNDDDGNRGVRINYVMEFGNYGYTDEFTGAGWRTPRTNMEAEIPLQHWHLNDPGVVPNLLQTGAGSPTGITVYEGSLLPEVFRGQVIHCDAGPNVVRAYPVRNDGAGYSAETVNILEGVRDQWFRPSDVTVAPDGSLIVADWYDPGVGGHRMGDIDKGRLFRVAPPGKAYTVPKLDLSSVPGCIDGLKSPNMATRYLAWTKLREMNERAEPELKRMSADRSNPRFQARALWLLSKMPARGLEHAGAALGDPNPDLRITALRAIRQITQNGPEGERDELVAATVKKLVRDPSPQVRRECAIALRHNQSDQAARLWTDLALQHDGSDRWYLEALGIAADKQWDRFLGKWLAKVGDDWNTPAGRDIIWRSRAEVTPEYLVKIIRDPQVSVGELPRYFRAFDFQRGEPKDRAIAELVFGARGGDPERQSLILAEAVSRLQGFDLAREPRYQEALQRVLEQSRGTPQFVSLVDKFQVADRYPELLAMAQENPDSQTGVEGIRVLLAREQSKLIAGGLSQPETAPATARVLGNSGDGRAVGLLLPLLRNDRTAPEVRSEAVRGMARSRNGAMQLLRLARENMLDPALAQAAAFSLHAATWEDVKREAAELFPLPAARNDQPLPPVSELLTRQGNAGQGLVVFKTVGTCANCHQVHGEGKEVGPNLSEIGSKLSREAMFESILFPSAGISHNYETYVVALESGDVLNGVLVTQTPETVSLRGADALVRTVKKSEIEEMRKQNVSLMPADLQKTMTAEELVDVVEYMQTLKKSSASSE